jgi:hypothetical protein
MPNTDGKVTVNQGDTIVVEAQGMKVKGRVHSASFWGGKDGWYIEIVDAVPTGYSYWKQGYDGGRIVEVNGKRVNTSDVIDTNMKKPRCQLIGTDGNIFSIIGKVQEVLRGAGQKDKAEEVKDRVFQSHSYNEALSICSEYVEVY